MSKLPVEVTRFFGNLGLNFKKNAPEIMLGAGILSGVAAFILSNRATYKAKEAIEERINCIKYYRSVLKKSEELEENRQKTIALKKENAKELTKTLVKSYWPTLILGAASVGLTIGSHKLLHNRAAGLASAVALLTSEFASYRDKIKQKLGEKEENDIYHGRETEIIEEEQELKNGKKKTVKKAVIKEPEAENNKVKNHMYSFVYCKGCTGWSHNPRESLNYLTLIEQHANDMLQAKGHLFMNDVLDMLGIPRVFPYGQQVGWMAKATEDTDGYISLGYADQNDPDKSDFLNGKTANVMLDLNCQGNIIPLLV